MSRKGIGGHQSAAANTEVWLTPPTLLEALGGHRAFDLDPCAAIDQPWPTAQHHYTVEDDGLKKPWFGCVWLNPPYTASKIKLWLSRLAEHGHGVGLIFARTDTEAFHRYVFERSDALLFIESRLFFHVAETTSFQRKDKEPIQVMRGGRAPANGGAPSVLCAYGTDCADMLAESGIDGAFVALKLRALIFGFDSPGSWVEEVMKAFADRDDPVTLDWLYRRFAGSPKAAGRKHWKAKIRQTLQRGPFEAVGNGQWRKPAV